MSPAATRRYRVRFIDMAEHETFVLAVSEEDAIAKAAAMHELNGLAEFTSSYSGAVDWEAELATPEVCS